MPGKNKRNAIVNYLPVYGCISTGVIYLSIGVIAILSFLKVKQGGADESNLIAFLNGSVIGKIFIWIILLGTVSYIAWRIFESIKDPYEYGKQAKGISLRIGIALSTLPDIIIAYTAIQVLLSKGQIKEAEQLQELRQQIGNLFEEGWGQWFFIAIGLIISMAAVVQLIYGFSKGYRERQNIDHFSAGAKWLIHSLAWVGYLARAIILGIIGYFLIKASALENAQYVVNTDKAFDFIGDHVGHLYFILVAMGTICYGLFMFVLGITYDADKD